MANNADPRFQQSRFSTGVKKATTTDPRYAPPRFKGAPAPTRYADKGRSGGASAISQKLHDESDQKNQYTHPVVCSKEPTAREE
jgi:hypothetical protein